MQRQTSSPFRQVKNMCCPSACACNPPDAKENVSFPFSEGLVAFLPLTRCYTLSEEDRRPRLHA